MKIYEIFKLRIYNKFIFIADKYFLTNILTSIYKHSFNATFYVYGKYDLILLNNLLWLMFT